LGTRVIDIMVGGTVARTDRPAAQGLKLASRR
jgi:hypothetical protein